MRPSGAGDTHVTWHRITGPMIGEEQRSERRQDLTQLGLNRSLYKGKNEAQEGHCRSGNKLVLPGKFHTPVGKSLQSSLKYLQGIGSSPVGGSTEGFEWGLDTESWHFKKILLGVHVRDGSEGM